MQLRRVMGEIGAIAQIRTAAGWVDAGEALRRLSPPLPEPERARLASDTVALLGAPRDVRSQLAAAAADISPAADDAREVLLPFEPRSFRDFMLYERHAIDAARGFVQRFMPGSARVVQAYEALLGAPFPKLKPHALWYRQPIYYMGNHLAFARDGAAVAVPAYTCALDYELELGFVLKRGLLDATPAEAEAAIGGFVVINDFSARDVQLDEMASGFGPQKAKHFRNGMSAVVVSADEILPRWRDLDGTVRINGQLVAEVTTAGPRWSLGEALAHASRSERLHAGELFATGTLPGGSGIENGRLLAAGDTIALEISGVGMLTNRITDKDEAMNCGSTP